MLLAGVFVRIAGVARHAKIKRDAATYDCIVQWLFERLRAVGAKGSLILQITTDLASLDETSHKSHWPHGNKSLRMVHAESVAMLSRAWLLLL